MDDRNSPRNNFSAARHFLRAHMMHLCPHEYRCVRKIQILTCPWLRSCRAIRYLTFFEIIKRFVKRATFPYKSRKNSNEIWFILNLGNVKRIILLYDNIVSYVINKLSFILKLFISHIKFYTEKYRNYNTIFNRNVVLRKEIFCTRKRQENFEI